MGKLDDEANKKVAQLDQTAELYPKEENDRLAEESKKEVIDQTAGPIPKKKEKKQ